MIWFLLVFAAATAFLCRFLPVLMKNSALLTNQKGSFYRFLSYSAQGMLGVIIYDTAFESHDIYQLLSRVNWLDALKLALLLVTFIWTVQSKKILPSFFFGLIVYFLVVFFVR